MAQKVHVGIVLDRSGSMEDCRADAIGAVNRYLRQVKEEGIGGARQPHHLRLAEYLIRDRVQAHGCAELGDSEYQPRAQTPLLDAVGHGAALLDRSKEIGERCILAIMTHGLENASREYTKETVKALLDRRQKEDGWLVLYLGAGHDAWEQARAMGLHAGNVAAFSKRHIQASMTSAASRGRRFAMADEPAEEAARRGFTERERAGMTKPKR